MSSDVIHGLLRSLGCRTTWKLSLWILPCFPPFSQLLVQAVRIGISSMVEVFFHVLISFQHVFLRTIAVLEHRGSPCCPRYSEWAGGWTGTPPQRRRGIMPTPMQKRSRSWILDGCASSLSMQQFGNTKTNQGRNVGLEQNTYVAQRILTASHSMIPWPGCYCFYPHTPSWLDS